MTPGLYVKTYREIKELTQAELGEKLGGLTRQRMYEIENGYRVISKNIAKKLSGLFDVPIEKFI